MQNDDLKFYLAKANGRPAAVTTANQIASGARGVVFDKFTSAQLAAGAEKVTKIFARNVNASNETMYGLYLWLDKPTSADDYEWFVIGTQRNVVADLTGSERRYGTAALKTDIGSGVDTGVFTFEAAALTGAFVDTDDVVLSKKPDGSLDTGTEEWLAVSGTPPLSGLDATVTFTTDTVSAYTVAEGARLSSAYSAGDLEPSVGTIGGSQSGTIALDDTQIVLDNVGCMEQIITISFPGTSGTFTVTSDDPDITLASGDTATDYAPLNPANSKPYITIPAAAWSGTPAASDSFTIPTTPPTVPLFVTAKEDAGSDPGYSLPQICSKWDY